MSTHGGMLGAVTHACEIHELTGCSLEEAFAFQRAMADFMQEYERATIESAAIPFDRLH